MSVADETVIVAVSGGADSLSLLLALNDLRARKKLDLRFIAAHFNHKLRERASDADEEFVKLIAADRGFELVLGCDRIAQEGNLEQNARNARYGFLAKTAASLRAGYVLTAHTVNDQAETFLLNLIRGSGADGLAGMRPVREFSPVPGDGGEVEREQVDRGQVDSGRLPFSPSPILLVRPLLRWARREDTENYCRDSGVEFRYDTMNEDMSFKRVRVRKMLLPMLKEFNPKIIETLAQTAELMQQGARPSASTPPAAEDPGNSTFFAEELSIRDLRLLDPAILQKTLRSWLKVRRGNVRSLGLKHIEAIQQLVHSQKSGRTVELPGSGVVRKHNGQLSFEKHKG